MEIPEQLIPEQLITKHLDVWSSSVKTKSSAGRGSNKKFELYGVAKLRKLILDLAVRGMLIPQDPRDEPAKELLEKITIERENLVQRGQIKKQKLPPLLDQSEQSFNVPPGWIWTSLLSICTLENGDRSKNYPNKSMLVKSGIPFINAGDLQDGYISKKANSFITEEHYKILNSGKFRDGDILFCLRGSLGKSAIVNGFEKGAIASSLVIIRSFSLTSEYFLQKYFDSPLSGQMIDRYDNGTAQPNLSAADLGRFCVPLPPFKEQYRIVAKVDELMALCDQLEQEQESNLETHETLVSTILNALTSSSADSSQFADAWQRIQDNFDILFTTENSFDQLKKTILQLAVMGKLVPQDLEDEHAAELAIKGIAEQEQLIKDGKAKRKKALPPISIDQIPFTLPENWLWIRLSEASFFQEGPGILAKDFRDSGVPLIRISGMHGTLVSLEGCNFLDVSMVDKKWSHFSLELGDIVLSSSASLGKVSEVSSETVGCIVYTGLIRFKTYSSLFKGFLINFFKSSEFIRQINKSKTGTAIKHFGPSHLKEMLIPLPPLAEQHRIVAKVDELLALCDQLKASLASAQDTQLNLADSLVEQAIN